MGLRKFYAGYVIKNFAYDLNRMVDSKQDPKDILRAMRKKLAFLESKKYNIVWWNELRSRKYDSGVKQVDVVMQIDKDLLENELADVHVVEE